jgi:hypothetical protein
MSPKKGLKKRAASMTEARRPNATQFHLFFANGIPLVPERFRTLVVSIGLFVWQLFFRDGEEFIHELQIVDESLWALLVQQSLRDPL